MSLKEQFSTAKAYIDAKKYDDARRVLKKIDHPKAKEWLDKLDTFPAVKAKRTRKKITWALLAVSLVMLAVGYLYLKQITDEAGRQADEMIFLIRINSRATVYCTNRLRLTEEVCEAWATETITNHRATLIYCGDIFDWIRETDLYTSCLTNRGVMLPG